MRPRSSFNPERYPLSDSGDRLEKTPSYPTGDSNGFGFGYRFRLSGRVDACSRPNVRRRRAGKTWQQRPSSKAAAAFQQGETNARKVSKVRARKEVVEAITEAQP